jgi:PAS domain S-box-containing protein
MSGSTGSVAAAARFPSELRELVEGLGAIVWQADARDWRFLLVSRNAREVLGYPIEQWLNDPDLWVNHIHPRTARPPWGICLNAAARGKDHRFEYRAIAADGRTVWLRDIVRVVSDEEGGPRELRGLMIDITEQKQAECALRENEERFRQFAENIREV